MKQKQRHKTQSDKEIKKFMKRLAKNYKRKMKNFYTMTGAIGRGVGC
ncbi:MAG: hypothetical protein IPI46_13830 [Bacteroidetes bacterium]|nr:hypothetical protein [Bacteroidota bacterium]